MTKLYNDTIDAGETIELTHPNIGNSLVDINYAYFLNGGEDQVSFNVEWFVSPRDSEEFFRSESEDEQNVNLEDGRVYYPNLSGGDEYMITIENEENNPVELVVYYQPYR